MKFRSELLVLSVLLNVIVLLCFWFEHLQFQELVASCGGK